MNSNRATDKLKSLVLITLCQVAGMALWFSASAGVPNLIATGLVSGQEASLLTSMVQLGFVVGTLISAMLGLADRFDPRRLFAACALLGATANAGILATGFEQLGLVAGLRFTTGLMMAGIYPVGMKMAAGWARQDMGLMIGILVGALTLGSALPHLFSSLAELDWRITLGAASISAVVAAVVVGLVQLGPGHKAAPVFVPRDALAILRRPPVLLATAGYLGHMWELYAMWAWIGAFMVWALPQTGLADASMAGNAALVTFAVIGSGALGSLAAGLLADRYGRTTITMIAMTMSGLCAATIGFSVEFGAAALLVVALVWGITVIADSAQFSAAIAELAEPRLLGTMLTVQTCLGFLLTIVTVQLMPIAIELLSWRYAFMVLAVGPLFGVLAMWALRRQPDSVRLANGHR